LNCSRIPIVPSRRPSVSRDMLQHALAAQPRQDDSRSIKCSRRRCRLLQQPSPMQGVRSPMGCVRAQPDCWPILTRQPSSHTSQPAIQAAILQVYLPGHDSHKARNSTQLLVKSWVRQACLRNSPCLAHAHTEQHVLPAACSAPLIQLPKRDQVMRSSLLLGPNL
jgi:hypothetical protein